MNTPEIIVIAIAVCLVVLGAIGPMEFRFRAGARKGESLQAKGNLEVQETGALKVSGELHKGLTSVSVSNPTNNPQV